MWTDDSLRDDTFRLRIGHRTATPGSRWGLMLFPGRTRGAQADDYGHRCLPFVWATAKIRRKANMVPNDWRG